MNKAENPGSVFANLNKKGLNLIDAGKYESAIAIFSEALDHALSLGPTDAAGILYNRAEAFRLSGNLALAKADILKALEFSPEDADIKHAIGLVCYEEDNFEEAAAWYQKAIEIAPRHEKAWNDLGVIHFRKGEYESARQNFEKAVGINPDFADAWFNLADTYDELGLKQEYRRALEALNTARMHVAEKDIL